MNFLSQIFYFKCSNFILGELVKAVLQVIKHWCCLFQLLEALDMDLYCRKMHLAHKLINVACTLEGDALDTAMGVQLC